MSYKYIPVLSEDAIRRGIQSINKQGPPYWDMVVYETPRSHVLRVHYKLKNFKTTWTFLNLVAQQAATLKHHPTITTTYNNVDIEITTHDAENMITEKDVTLADAIHKEYQQLLKKTTK